MADKLGTFEFDNDKRGSDIEDTADTSGDAKLKFGSGNMCDALPGVCRVDAGRRGRLAKSDGRQGDSSRISDSYNC